MIIEEIIAPFYTFFNLEIDDDSIIEKIISYLAFLIESKDYEIIKSHLYPDSLFYTFNLSWVIRHEIRKVKDPFDSWYPKWVVTYGKFLLELAKLSREEDSYIQQELNYNDFIQELGIFPEGQKILFELYNLRGLDFFLFHFAGRETTALEDDGLFNNVQFLSRSLMSIGRSEEAKHLATELKKRKKLLVEIRKDFLPINQESNLNTIELLRVFAERFWLESLDAGIWQHLESQSKKDLIDSFVEEEFSKRGILQNGRQAVLSFCRVIERELAHILFYPWLDEIRIASFKASSNLSKVKSKSIPPREQTFRILKKGVKGELKPPTLGQLLFIGKFFDDNIMDSCTDLFTNVRKKTNLISPDYGKKIILLIKSLEDRYSVNSENPNIIELRNAAAHPGHETKYMWSSYLTWIKDCFIKPPKKMLHLLAIELKP